jgi:hypothetical protein
MSRPPAPPGLPTVTSAWPARAALALLLASLAAFLAWQYGMSRAFESRFLLNHAGVEHFRGALGLPGWEPALGPYRAGFRALLGLSWVTYFALLMAGGLGGPLPGRRALSFILVGAALAAAFLWPPSFSCDIYAYVGYARMKVLHGVNPYVTSQQWLIDHHDATGPFLRWNIASPYGPLWTTLSVALVGILRGASLTAQIVAFKLLGAGALLAAAWGGARVAERLAPGRGELTLLAIGLNPLFVMEAAGNGHNDFVMMALVVWAFAAALERRTLLAVLLAGAAGAIKFLPFLLVPWLVLADWRSRALPWRSRAREGVAFVLLALAPIALSLWPWWMGASTMRGLRQHWGSQVSGDSGVYAWVQATLFLAIFGAATVWALRGEDRAGEDRLPRVMGAWVVVTSLVFMVTTGVWLPWYLSWIWIVALLDWNRRALTFSYLAFCFAVVLTIRYSVPA